MGFSYDWLKDLFLNSRRCDLELHVQKQVSIIATFPVHSLVLCAQNTVFEQTFDEQEGRIRKITLSDVEPRTAGYFLRAYYIKTFPSLVPQHNLLELLKLSNQYQFQELMVSSQENLQKEVTLDMACLVYETFTSVNKNTLKETCQKMVQEKIDTVLENDLHFDLQENSLNEFLAAKPDLPQDLRENGLLRWRNWNLCLKGKDIEVKEPQNSPYNCSAQTLQWVNDLFLNPEFSDIEFRFKENSVAKFNAHSLILSQHSQVFRSLYEQAASQNTQLRKIILDNISPRVAEYLLRFIYTRFFPKEISETNLMKLLRSAHYYKIKDLIPECITSLKGRVSITNCCQIFSLANELELEELRASSLTLASANLDNMLKNYLNYCLKKEELYSVFVGATETELQESDLSDFLKEWEKWRRCVTGVRQLEAVVARLTVEEEEDDMSFSRMEI